MNPEHKKILRRNRVRLVEDMHADWMYDHLAGANIYEPWQVEEFAANKTKRLQNGALLTSIETRGPKAFDAFVDALRSSNQGHIAEILLNGGQMAAPFTSNDQPTSQPMEVSQSELSAVWPNPSTPTNFRDVKIEPIANVSETMMDAGEVYKMQSRPRGLAYIINNKHFRSMKTRQGTDVDKRNLEHTFEQLGFNIDTHEDLRAGQMQLNLRELSKLNHSTFDCLVVAILSHGIDGAVYGTDEHLVKVEDVIKYFDGQNCPSMAGKPKLFFLQACRGERFDSGTEATDAPDAANANSLNQIDREEQPEADRDIDFRQHGAGDDIADPELEAQRLLEKEMDATDSWRSKSNINKLPNTSDMLLAYATVPGYVSWRNSERGSWFVQALCETFLEQSRKEDLLSMIIMVNNKVAKAFESSTGRHKQMPAPVVMLRKKLYFFPGHYQEIAQATSIAQPTS